MDTYLEEYELPCRRPPEDIPSFPYPIEPVDAALACFQLASRIGRQPFDEDECSRSLWVVILGDWGVWVRAVVPVDDRLDAADRANLTARCAAVVDLLGEPECYGTAVAAVILRRPAPDKPSRADKQIFRLLTKAAAGRDTVLWSFLVAGPDGYTPLLTRAKRERYRLVH